jgi:hypothetical protein
MFKDAKDVGKLARELSLLESKVKLYEEELINLRSTRYTFDSIFGKSEAIKNLTRSAQSIRQPVPGTYIRGKRDGKRAFCPGHSSCQLPAPAPVCED